MADRQPNGTTELTCSQADAERALSHLRRDLPQFRAEAGTNDYLAAVARQREAAAAEDAARAEAELAAQQEAAAAEQWRIRGGLYLIAGVCVLVGGALLARRLFYASVRPVSVAAPVPALVDVGAAEGAFVAAVTAPTGNAISQALSNLVARAS